MLQCENSLEEIEEIKLSRKKKRRRRKKQAHSVELIGIILIFLAILIIGEFGFVGKFLANITKVFVGTTFQFLGILLILLGSYFIFKGKTPKVKGSPFWGIMLFYLTVLLWLHLTIFKDIMAADVNIITVSWQNLRLLFSTPDSVQMIGGGMIGALLYAGSYFLFANVGTYILVGLLSFISIMTIGDFSYQSLFDRISTGLKKIFNWNKKQLQQLGLWIKENFQSDKKQKKKKKAKHKKLKENKETPLEQKERRARKHVPIEGMQQTSLPIEAESPTVEQPANDEVEEDEELVINFVSDEENKDYKLPPLSLLDDYKQPDQSNEYLIIEENIKILEDTFESFGVEASVVKANLGPAVTKYEIEPATGVKVSRIVSLTDDIALALAANDIRIEAPIPGKALIGIEVPNSSISTVHYKEVMLGIENMGNPHPLAVPLGRDIAGNVAIAELNKMPHLLIAGATGSGKSVGINVMIASILMRTKPHEVKMMLIDPKRVELNIYDGIPHLLTPVVTKPKKAARALQNIVEEMDKRYELFEMSGARNLESYNEQLRTRKEKGEEGLPAELPYIIVVVDELADLMMVAAKEVEDAIIRLAQMARAAGIHMILATQRPSVDVITGLIKANVPSRIAFATSSGTDSRTILDSNGAEKLLGRGDMLFAPMGANKAERIQGAFISDAEVQAITDFVRDQQEANYVEEMIPQEEAAVGAGGGSDELYDDAYKLVIELDTASISMLQRKFRIGYNRAANIMDDLEANGIVSPQDGSKPRDVLVDSIAVENDLNQENLQEYNQENNNQNDV